MPYYVPNYRHRTSNSRCHLECITSVSDASLLRSYLHEVESKVQRQEKHSMRNKQAHKTPKENAAACIPQTPPPVQMKREVQESEKPGTNLVIPFPNSNKNKQVLFTVIDQPDKKKFPQKKKKRNLTSKVVVVQKPVPCVWVVCMYPLVHASCNETSPLSPNHSLPFPSSSHLHNARFEPGSLSMKYKPVEASTSVLSSASSISSTFLLKHPQHKQYQVCNKVLALPLLALRPAPRPPHHIELTADHVHHAHTPHPPSRSHEYRTDPPSTRSAPSHHSHSRPGHPSSNCSCSAGYTGPRGR
ncbi:hypothetical protein BDY21DRAFT_359066 [Lineolata rhizophorae]|uniref:Uncharacterized protein n=1 Tax=Lineolata rhizophorae TaxID=578093 RepID=A0A6A6NL98_9PEZI|nr:hypothetical protein BDY21DRAFT_359066 [Lineolata rhizophorae]